jgi:hypothetical protein
VPKSTSSRSVFEPKRVAHFLEALSVKQDGAMFLAGLAVVPAAPNTAVARQHHFEERDLHRGRFLYAQHVGPDCSMATCSAYFMFTR